MRPLTHDEAVKGQVTRTRHFENGLFSATVTHDPVVHENLSLLIYLQEEMKMWGITQD